MLEINVTPNRGDALSHLGVAREAAAVLGVPLHRKLRLPAESGAPVSDAIRIEIADPVGCPRFTARVLEGVRIAPSPAWLRRRLERCGVRSINNVVDVTNYVMLELGQPFHAFDLDRIQAGCSGSGGRAKGEPLTTLDGKPRTLVADDLVIEDTAAPSHSPAPWAGPTPRSATGRPASCSRRRTGTRAPSAGWRAGTSCTARPPTASSAGWTGRCSRRCWTTARR